MCGGIMTIIRRGFVKYMDGYKFKYHIIKVEPTTKFFPTFYAIRREYKNSYVYYPEHFSTLEQAIQELKWVYNVRAV